MRVSKGDKRLKRPTQIEKKEKDQKKQCGHMDCVKEARPQSKYCSDECGYEMNKRRYAKFFVPKWNEMKNNQSQAHHMRTQEVYRLDSEKKNCENLIKELKDERDSLEKNIAIIKQEAKLKYDQQKSAVDEKEDDEDFNDADDNEEAISGDLARPFCFTCGLTIQPPQALKHWASCHKRTESTYFNTADVPVQYRTDDDPNPELFCQHYDKKTKRFCMNLYSACPQHKNWTIEKDEVCGCPLKIMQTLVPDGNYCLELKKECNIHYHWDKFRLAQNNIKRIQAFQQLDIISDKIKNAISQLNDSHGGCVGIMLHTTIDHNQ